MSRAVTLLELLTVIAILGLVTVAVSRAYVSTLDYDQRVRAGRSSLSIQYTFEDRIASFIRHAELSAATTQQASYFIGSIGDVASTAATGGTAGASGAPTLSTPTSSSGSGNGNADTLILTVTGLRVPSSILELDDDFETQNTARGPQGGVEEVAISTTAVGSPPNGQTGLFLRYQRPADSDPSQGGNELLLAPEISSIQFEFWDGTQYQATWDTRTMTPQRMPAAVRVTYRVTNDNNDHVFVVAVPNSDVTSQKPVVTTGTTTTP